MIASLEELTSWSSVSVPLAHAAAINPLSRTEPNALGFTRYPFELGFTKIINITRKSYLRLAPSHFPVRMRDMCRCSLSRCVRVDHALAHVGRALAVCAFGVSDSVLVFVRSTFSASRVCASRPSSSFRFETDARIGVRLETRDYTRRRTGLENTARFWRYGGRFRLASRLQ